MIKYYKELDNPNDNYIDLTRYINNPKIKVNLSKEDESKCLKLISVLEKKDPLYNHCLGTVFLNLNNDLFYENIESLIYTLYFDKKQITYDNLINDIDFINQYGITEEILHRFIFLINEFNKKNSISDYDATTGDIYDKYEKFYNDLEKYISSCVYIMTYEKNKIDIKKYLDNLSNVLYYQKKISKEEYIEISKYINSLEKYKIIKLNSNVETIKRYLPNDWYITPSGELYNAGGPGGHKGQKLTYQMNIIRNRIYSGHSGHDLPFYNQKNLIETRKRGYFELSQFSNYLHYVDYPATIDFINENKYDFTLEKRCYNKKIYKIIIGIMDAEEAVINYYNYLINESNDVVRDCKKISCLSLDEFFVRCCGFYKILSDRDVHNKKTIVTSDSNYHENLKEYINHGWHVDYVKPFVMFDGKLQEMPDYHENVLEFHYGIK